MTWGRHYDLVSWDAIMTSYPRILGRHYDLVSWGAIMTEWDAIMTPL